MNAPAPSVTDRLQALSTRARVAIGTALALVVVLAVALVASLGGDDPDAGAAGSPGASQSPGSPQSAGSVPTVDPSALGTPQPGETPTPAQPGKPGPKPVRVPLDQPADLRNGVTVRLASIEPVRGEGRGPGESSGPSLRVTVVVDNDSDETVSMLSAVVTMSYGAANTPADDLSGPGVKRFPLEIKPGAQGEGRFVFQVPPAQRGRVAVDFGYTTEAPRALFRGSAA